VTHSTLARRAWVLLLVPAVLAAQGRRGGGQGAPAPSTDLQWRNIGPNSAGRMVAVAGSAARPKEYYFGTTGGGVWKTVDGGNTLTPVTDAYFGGTIGALAVQENNPDVVWAGGGESPIRGNVSHGDGVWKTSDAGKTWTYMGLKETQQISRIRIDPTNPDVVYVGALGHVWAPNAERGVYKTTDGGKSWKKILFRDDSTGVADLIMDPSNPKVLYAALWQAGRKPWLLISGGKGSGIFKTTDGGDHWTEITRNPGLPSGVIGRVGLAVSPVKTNKVWALIENEPGGGMYASNDGGNTWTFLSGDRELRQRAWYYANIYADPKDTLTLVAPQVSPMWTHDGGKTWARGFGGGDNHDVYWAPDDPKRIAMAHDNGTIITTDGGTNSIRVAAPTGQFYHVYLTSRFPVYDVCGAKQDAGSSCGPVRSAPAGGRGGGGGGRGAAPATTPGYSEFYGAAGGESGYMAGAPYNPEITYGGNYSGVIDMQNRATGERERLDPWPLNPMGHDAKDSKYRFQWTFPIMNSPFEPHTLYAGSNVVFKSINDGKTWTVISPDLTKHDPATLGASGGPITKDQTSIEYYATVFALQESPIAHGLLWAGSDDGLIHVTRDGGKTWKNVTPKGLPEWTRISIIDPSPHNPGTAYVAANRYQLDDFAPYLYKTTDYGATWTKITTGIPADQFTRSIREDLVQPGMLYASTERGMYVSYDAGAHWESLQKNLPPVPVHDIALRDDDMVIATHGRAFWVMEGLTMLREAKVAAAAASAGKDFLYKPAAAYRATGGVVVQYALAHDNEPVTIEFLEPSGKLIRKYSSTDTVAQGGRGGGGGRGGFGGAARVTNRTGLNRFTWNLQYPDASTFRDMILWQGATSGPAAAPGDYKVRLTVGSAAPLTETFTVKKDPRVDYTNADLVEQHRFAMQLRDRVSAANDGVKTVRNVKGQIEDRAPKMSSNPAFGPAAQKFAEQLSNVEDSLYQTKNKSGEDPLNFPIRINNQMAALLGFVENGDRRPPKQSYDVFAVLDPQLTRQLTRLKTTLDTNLPKLNAMLKAAGQPEIVPAPVEPPVAARAVVP
jgi:photosystem II stability/assembly factor-like uncharacterized protein